MKFESIPAGGRMLSVYLPPSYASGGSRRYPVLYVQDDAELMEHSVNFIDSLYASGELPELIVAGVPSACRNDDYTPWPAEAVAPGRPGFGGAGRAYVDELAGRIKPALDAQLRTMPEPEHTGIGGGSLGGLIALLAAYWRPDAFGAAAAISPRSGTRGRSTTSGASLRRMRGCGCTCRSAPPRQPQDEPPARHGRLRAGGGPHPAGEGLPGAAAAPGAGAGRHA